MIYRVNPNPLISPTLCSADGSTHTESNKLYRKVKHRYPPNLSPRQRPTAKARLEQAALAASAGAGSHTPSTASESSHISLYLYIYVHVYLSICLYLSLALYMNIYIHIDRYLSFSGLT